MPNKIFIASDHAGVELKSYFISTLQDIEIIDLGPNSTDSVDYPDYASKVCNALKEDSEAIGVLICGSGIGMSMRANRYSHIRAALCMTTEMATLTRSHNNANVLCLAARLNNDETNLSILKTFLRTEFEGGRHERRIEKINSPT